MSQSPNKSPESTAIRSRHSFGANADGAVRSAVAIHFIWSRVPARWTLGGSTL